MNDVGFWRRLRSDTPPFFKRAQVFGLSLAALATSVTQISMMPPAVVHACSYLIAIGGTISALSQFAVQNLNSK